MKIYLAGPYSWKEKLKGYAQELLLKNIKVTSRWLDEPHAPDTTLREVPATQLSWYAANDLEDIYFADIMIFFSVDPETPIVRGGRHVEFGYDLCGGTRIIVIGPRENIFHYLSQVKHFATWEEFTATI